MRRTIKLELEMFTERNQAIRLFHDSISQNLFGALLITESLIRSVSPDARNIVSLLRQIHVLNTAAMCEMRLLLYELNPGILEKIPLEKLCSYIATVMKTRRKMQIFIRFPLEPLQLPGAVQVAFYRIALEALTNMTRHSTATETTLSLIEVNDGVEFSINDNGSGFDPVQTTGRGIQAMQAWATEAGVSLTLVSSPGKGTRVSARWVHIST